MGYEPVIMQCGHEYYDYELSKIDDIVYIKRFCVKKCETDWEMVGEAPAPEDMKIILGE